MVDRNTLNRGVTIGAFIVVVAFGLFYWYQYKQVVGNCAQMVQDKQDEVINAWMESIQRGESPDVFLLPNTVQQRESMPTKSI